MVWSKGWELPRAGVDGLEHRPKLQAVTKFANFLLSQSPNLADLNVGEAVLFDTL